MKKKSKGYARGGKTMKPKGMNTGGKMPMVEKDGKMVPAFAADGKGKMMGGGMVMMSPEEKRMMRMGGMPRMSTKMMAGGGLTGALKADMKKANKGGMMKSKMGTKGGVKVVRAKG